MEINKKNITHVCIKNNMKERSMPICFTADQYAKIEKVAKQKGMLNAGQLIEKVLADQ